jgi:hypothetical protein
MRSLSNQIVKKKQIYIVTPKKNPGYSAEAGPESQLYEPSKDSVMQLRFSIERLVIFFYHKAIEEYVSGPTLY